MEENSRLKQNIEDLKLKYVKSQIYLDQMMENQSKQEFLKNGEFEKEMKVCQHKFDQAINSNYEIIKNQNSEISGLIHQIEILKKENFQLKQERVYVCEECDFETNNKLFM